MFIVETRPLSFPSHPLLGRPVQLFRHGADGRQLAGADPALLLGPGDGLEAAAGAAMKANPVISRIRLLCAVVLVLFAAAAAEDVLLLLPKNFDVRAHKGWSWNKQEGRKELTAYQSSQTVLQFRGSRVTAGGVWTYRYPCKGGGVFINKVKTEIVATYDKGHLSGTYESRMRNSNQGCAASNDAEFLQVYYKGTVSGEAGSDGILKITVQMTEHTILGRESTSQKLGEGKGAITKTIYGGGWKKRDQEPNLYSWGAEFKLPVGELQSSQKFIGQKEDAGAPPLSGTDGESGGEPGAGEAEPGDANVNGVGPATMPPESSDGAQYPGSPVTPGQEAGAAAAAGVIMVIGSFLFSLGMGVSPSDIRDAVDVIFTSSRQTAPAPAPSPLPIQALHYEGDISANGEIWSENYGWVNPAEYQRGLATGRLIDRVNAGINARPDAVARDLGRAWTDSQRTIDDMRETRRFVDLSTRLAENFGTAAETTWCLDFVNRHARAGPNGYQIDPETAREMYSGLKKQMYASGQIANMADADFQNSVSAEIGRKTEVVVQIRDNATRVNRVLARFDPTGTGQKIVGWQQGAYAAVDGYDKGGIAAAAESAVLAVSDNYTQGYASGNYQALKGAYAEYGITDELLAARIGKANFETANNKYNVLDHAGKAADNLLEGNIGAAVDSSLDALDAKDSLKDDFGKAKDWATSSKTGAHDKVPEPQADSTPDTTPDVGKKSLGTMRRESFEQTRKSFENETEMMQQLNRVSDIPDLDLDHRQAELIRVRNSDPSTFNVVQKQLHPDTAEVISKTNQFTSDRVVERQAQILHDQGYSPEVRLTGKAGGADTDGYWTLKDNQGNVLPDSETRKLASDALKQASDDVLQPLGTDADQMGHKIMNESPEKFAADPNELGIKSRDGKLVDGKLVFKDHEKTGDHWSSNRREEALKAPKDRVSGAVMTRENADSLGEVMKTKTQHLDDIARHKGAVSESDRRDMARELVKTNNRTFLPMARKAGVTPNPEFRDLMQKLMLTRDGEISSDQLPPISEIDRIVRDNVERLKDAIKE